MDKLTSELDKILTENKNIKDYIFDNQDEFIELSFGEYLSEIMKNKSITKVWLIDAAQLDKTYGYEIFRGEKIPSRNYVLRISFAMGLSLTETNRLLKVVGHNPLYSRKKRDCIIIDAINKKKSLEECYAILRNCS